MQLGHLERRKPLSSNGNGLAGARGQDLMYGLTKILWCTEGVLFKHFREVINVSLGRRSHTTWGVLLPGVCVLGILVLHLGSQIIFLSILQWEYSAEGWSVNFSAMQESIVPSPQIKLQYVQRCCFCRILHLCSMTSLANYSTQDVQWSRQLFLAA